MHKAPIVSTSCLLSSLATVRVGKKALELPRRRQESEERNLQSNIGAARVALFAAAGLFAITTTSMRGQNIPTAAQPLHISVFGGGSGVETDFFSGRNADITSGIDLVIRPYRGVHPSIEARGSIAVNKGDVDSQKKRVGRHYVGRQLWAVSSLWRFSLRAGRDQLSRQRGAGSGNLYVLQVLDELCACRWRRSRL